ncbi:unnamed protein product, partial [Symbiodinium pilosum]
MTRLKERFSKEARKATASTPLSDPPARQETGGVLKVTTAKETDEVVRSLRTSKAPLAVFSEVSEDTL